MSLYEESKKGFNTRKKEKIQEYNLHTVKYLSSIVLGTDLTPFLFIVTPKI
jgi:hypothetical protein